VLVERLANQDFLEEMDIVVQVLAALLFLVMLLVAEVVEKPMAGLPALMVVLMAAVVVAVDLKPVPAMVAAE
jgi:hypothetical protein